jgi:hypothetical protein
MANTVFKAENGLEVIGSANVTGSLTVGGEFNISGKSYSVENDKYIEQLTDKIRVSKQISPLIVVIDKEGPYILEGSHRIDALKRLDAKSFPALIVIDYD